jgi:AcrR family transcriptional regulator
MARPRSDDKRKAIMAAAIRVIAAQGLGAPTAAIAKAADVSNGSLFTYFETKAELLNQLYLEIKTEMAAASMDGLPVTGDIREQSFHMWTRWMHWAAADPDKRRALAHLGVSDEITPASREAGHRTMAGIAALIAKSREHGPMRAAPLEFVVAMMNALADTTIDFMIRDKANAQTHCLAGFEALWRVIG